MGMFALGMASSKPTGKANISTISDVADKLRESDEQKYRILGSRYMRAKRIEYLKSMMLRAMLLLVVMSIFLCVMLAAKLLWLYFHRSKTICLVPYNDGNGGDVRFVNGWFHADQSIFDPHNFIEEEFEIPDDNYIKIRVGEFPNGRAGLFIHDFTRNITALVDDKSEMCFLLRMNRTLIIPPANLREMMLNVHKGMYNLDNKVLKRNYHAHTDPITEDVRDNLPNSIKEECAAYPVFLLSPIRIVKRSVNENVVQKKYSVFSGKKIHEIGITNLDSLWHNS